MVAVSSDPLAKSDEYARDEGILFPMAGDPTGATIRAWGLSEEGETRSVPASFVVDRGGRILYRQVGGSIGDRSEVDDLLAALTP